MCHKLYIKLKPDKTNKKTTLIFCYTRIGLHKSCTKQQIVLFLSKVIHCYEGMLIQNVIDEEVFSDHCCTNTIYNTLYLVL